MKFMVGFFILTLGVNGLVIDAAGPFFDEEIASAAKILLLFKAEARKQGYIVPNRVKPCMRRRNKTLFARQKIRSKRQNDRIARKKSLIAELAAEISKLRGAAEIDRLREEARKQVLRVLGPISSELQGYEKKKAREQRNRRNCSAYEEFLKAEYQKLTQIPSQHQPLAGTGLV